MENMEPAGFHHARRNFTGHDPFSKGVAKIVRDSLYLAAGDKTWVVRSNDALTFPSVQAAEMFLRTYSAELRGAEVV